MNSITPEQAAKIEALKLQLVGIKNTIVSAIEAAGFTVATNHQNPHTTFPRFLLDVTSAKLDKWSKTVFVELVAGRYTTTPEKVQVSYKASNIGRGRMRRFTVLDSIDSKLVAVLSEDLTASIGWTKSRTAAEAENARWEARRVAELKGLALPPGMTANIIQGNGESAGSYNVRFENFGSSIINTPLTVEQVARLAALLNEFQRTSELVVIRATWNGKVWYWSRGYDWTSFSNSVSVLRPGEVDQALELAKSKSRFDGAVIEAVPYAALSTVS